MTQKEIFSTIKQSLQQSLSYLQYVDLQKGQFSSQFTDIPIPAALIEFKEANWSNLKAGNQIGETMVSIYVYKKLPESFDVREQETESLNMLTIQEDVFQALEQLSGKELPLFNRVKEEVQLIENKFLCFRTDFRTVQYANIESKIEKKYPNYKLIK